MKIETFKYDNAIVRAFSIACVVFGVVGMVVGLLAAVQIYFPAANLGLSFTTFGRIRPLHTNAVIFAFVGNGMFAGIYYSLQRLCKARMFNDGLSWLHFLMTNNKPGSCNFLIACLPSRRRISRAIHLNPV